MRESLSKSMSTAVRIFKQAHPDPLSISYSLSVTKPELCSDKSSRSTQGGGAYSKASTSETALSRVLSRRGVNESSKLFLKYKHSELICRALLFQKSCMSLLKFKI